MLTRIIYAITFALAAPLLVFGQEYTEMCRYTPDTISITPMVNYTQPLVLIYVDFPDGLVPSTGQPPRDTIELQLVPNQNAVGSLGWHRTNPDSSYYKVVRKYTYDDYWDQFFSTNMWVGTRHPDYTSHNGVDPDGCYSPVEMSC